MDHLLQIAAEAPKALVCRQEFETDFVGLRRSTTGTADGSILPGAMIWFYSLDQQPDGSWRLVGGGSGP